MLDPRLLSVPRYGKWLLLVGALGFVGGCQKPVSGQPGPGAGAGGQALLGTSASASPKSLSPTQAVSVVAPTASGAAPTASASPSQPSAAAKPTPGALKSALVLDPETQADMNLCATARAAGRKATVAKDYAKADEELSKCLAVASWEPQALAERGYARLQAGRLEEAEADLKLASDFAPRESLLLQQILHNRFLAAQKRSDERAARGFAADEKALKDRRRRPANLSCEQRASATELKPQRPASLPDALRSMREANAKAGEVSPEAVEFRVVGAADVRDSDLERDAARAGGTLPQSANTLTTEGGSVTMNHILVSKGGQLYLFADLSHGSAYRCGVEGLARLTIAGGGHQPWHIVKDVPVMEPGQRCDASGDCMSYCPWSSSEIDVIILDARTLEGVSAVRLSFTSGNDWQPEGLLDFDWQPSRFVVKGCGAPATHPYVGE